MNRSTTSILLFFLLLLGRTVLDGRGPQLVSLSDIQRHPHGVELAGELSDGSSAAFSLSYYSLSSVRITLTPEGAAGNPFNLLDDNVQPTEVPFDLEETSSHFVLATEAFSVRIQKSPAQVSFLDPSGDVILEEYPEAGLEQLNSTAFRLDSDDHFFGFGEKYGPLDKRGTRVECYNHDAGDSYGDETYINIPFFMNPRGYGLFYHTTWKTVFHLGDLSPDWFSMSADGGDLDYFFIYGPELKPILKTYADLTGHMELPPKWALGLWHGTYTGGHKGMAGFGQEEFLDIARTFREEELPIDVLRIDSNWDDLVGSDYLWHKTYPEPVKMIEELKRAAYKMSVHDRPIPYGVLREYPLRRGWLVPPQLEYLDFSIPEAVQWWWRRHEVLLDMGVDAFKPDIGEEIPEDASFANGMSGSEMHNLYARLYVETHFKGLKQYTGKRSVVFARSGYVGSHKYPLVWGGDQHYSRWDHLPTLIRAGQCIGLSGFPIWSQDIGGIGTQKGIIPPAELYVRWAQFGFFNGVPQTFGRPWREPWKYDEKAYYGIDVTKIFREFDNLRYRLLPYIYSLVWEARQAGLPLMRAMVLEFQGDPQSWEHDLQYTFGPAFLVAPIYEAGNEREVYLPAGTWYDYWSDEIHAGLTILTVKPELNRMPLYVRGGAVVPMGPVMQFTGEVPLDPLEFHIYPAEGATDFAYYDDDGESYDYEVGIHSVIRISCVTTARAVEISSNRPAGEYKNQQTKSVYIHTHQFRPSRVLLNGKRLRSRRDPADLENTTQGWAYDNSNNRTIVRIPYSALEKGLVLTLSK